MKIKVEHVTKKYNGNFALDDVSFVLDEPKIYGLLGRNGAGKTTFMDILAGHNLATSGTITIDGEDPFDQQHISEKICLIKEGGNFKKDLKVKHVLTIYEYFYPRWDKELAFDLVKQYKLPLNARVKALSKGMESALGIIVGLSSKAQITIFDEPYIGLDAAARKRFYNVLLEEYEKEPRMIIFSTHLIDEVSLLFEEVLILQEGKLILQEDAESLRNRTCIVSGTEAEVEEFIETKEVLDRKKLAGMMTAHVFAPSEEARLHGLTAENIPIQDLMIYLTESEGDL